ncbi:F-box/FBD/LRR-repeat protein At1g13570-like [Apium graveolens]|uniref:F-box/FBD/LRR-repeat protein At1g13570-like n=1 Tax=Apium graveolens TaxID=4045 RepID=UPI003D7B0FDF
MAESSTRRIRRLYEDRISELPRNLQEAILGFLPIQDAVKTSILSKKWRHCWTMTPHLIFDYHFANYRMLNKFIDFKDPELRAHKFVTVINKVLLLHNGSILKFSLDFPDYFFSNRIIHEYIDQWIPLLSRKGIKQLTLQESSPLEDFTTHDLSSLDLTHLTLSSVWFPYTPELGRFTCLTNLKLVDATSNFGKSIFNCPVLEKLTLILCTGLFHTNFCAPNLKCLIQVYREITSEYSVAGLENLSEYYFLLLGYPNMQTEASNVVKVLDGFYKVKRFSIAMYFLKYLAAGGSPYRLSRPLSCLKTLQISDVNFCDLSVVSCLLCLIRSAPNLCKLHIKADGNLMKEVDEENLKSYCIDDSEDCTIDHLEIVTFAGFEGQRPELELVRFLLGHSPLLKIMSIDCSEDIERDDELTMAKEMLQYSRASSRAQIRRINHPNMYKEFEFNLWKTDEMYV